MDPGCILPTQHAAVIDALETFIPFSKEENREYIAVICHSEEGYWVSNPIYGEEGVAFVSHEELKELVFNFCPENSQTVGYVHTHGSSKMELYEGSLEIFSSADINYAKQYGLDGYLGTPEGSIQYYDFSEDTCQCISQ